MTTRIWALFAGGLCCGAAIACSSGSLPGTPGGDAGPGGPGAPGASADGAIAQPTGTCVRGAVPADSECTAVVATSAESFGPSENGGYLSQNRWLVSWNVQGSNRRLQLWMRSDFRPRAGTCRPYTTLPTQEMQCLDGTDGTGALAVIGVYDATCEARAHGLPGCYDDGPDGALFERPPSYLVASGSLEVSAVAAGDARWSGRIAKMKIVEACTIPNIESAETVPKQGGRCYLVDDARWDTR